MTAAEAAAALGITTRRVRILCQRGQLPGAVQSNPANPARGEWVIPAAAVAQYRAHRPQRGWPKGKPRKQNDEKR